MELPDELEIAWEDNGFGNEKPCNCKGRYAEDVADWIITLGNDGELYMQDGELHWSEDGKEIHGPHEAITALINTSCFCWGFLVFSNQYYDKDFNFIHSDDCQMLATGV